MYACHGRPFLLTRAVPMQAVVKQAAKDAGAEASDEDDGGIVEVDEETLRQREAAAAAALAAAAPLTQVLTHLGPESLTPLLDLPVHLWARG